MRELIIELNASNIMEGGGRDWRVEKKAGDLKVRICKLEGDNYNLEKVDKKLRKYFGLWRFFHFCRVSLAWPAIPPLPHSGSGIRNGLSLNVKDIGSALRIFMFLETMIE